MHARGEVHRRALDAADAWASALKSSVDVLNPASVAAAAHELPELEEECRALVAELTRQRRKPLEEAERMLLLEELRHLKRRALVCASILESHVLYLQWSQSARAPAREYTSEGAVETARPPVKSWEV